jgi:hypothetical protein
MALLFRESFAQDCYAGGAFAQQAQPNGKGIGIQRPNRGFVGLNPGPVDVGMVCPLHHLHCPSNYRCSAKIFTTTINRLSFEDYGCGCLSEERPAGEPAQSDFRTTSWGLCAVAFDWSKPPGTSLTHPWFSQTEREGTLAGRCCS